MIIRTIVDDYYFQIWIGLPKTAANCIAQIICAIVDRNRYRNLGRRFRRYASYFVLSVQSGGRLCMIIRGGGHSELIEL